MQSEKELLTELIFSICKNNKIKQLDEKQLDTLLEHISAQIKEQDLDITKHNLSDNKDFILKLTVAITLVNTLNKNLDKDADKELINKLTDLFKDLDKKLTKDDLKKFDFKPEDLKKLSTLLSELKKDLQTNLKLEPKAGSKKEDEKQLERDPLEGLLGIMNSHITGSLQVAMEVFNGDFLGIPSVNPYSDTSEDNLSRKTRITDTQFGDALGLNEDTIDLLASIGDVTPKVSEGIADYIDTVTNETIHPLPRPKH